MTSPQPTSPQGSPGIDARVSAEKARVIQSDTHWRMCGYVMCTWVVGWVLFDAEKAVLIWLWLATVGLMTVLNVAEEIFAKKRPARPEAAPQRLRASTRSMLIFGGLWAVGVVVLWPAQRTDMQVFLMLLTAGMTTSALLSVNVHLPAFYAFFVPCVGSVIVVSLWHGGFVNYVLAVATTIYLVASVRFVKTLNQTFVELIRARFEVEDLARSLHVQKEVAEEASRSKSRFLAAASHDLRQPVHSLSLFVGALAQQPQTPDGANLLTHLQAMVESLGTMFNALLNLSKLDAKTVQPEWATVDLQRLLQGICDAEALGAQDKELVLRLNARPLWVKTDPALLDRIVRNLVANAVRYTDTGGVLVTARVRAGHVVLRIVDTGQGIPADKQAAVFDEFVQLHNPERDRHNGLGLGLAIVRRLTELLGIPLQLRSQLGRGSVFLLNLGAPQPRFAEGAFPAAAVQALNPCTGANDQAMVIVIDDDKAIRVGASALLTSWGYNALAVDGLQALLPFIAEHPHVPQLVICDLRLRDGENGIDTVDYLRNQYNEDFPAILITGDTDPDRLRQAMISGLPVLHKPVAPEALKAAIAQAMQAGVAAAPHAWQPPPPAPG